jgi:hypothetical protein
MPISKQPVDHPPVIDKRKIMKTCLILMAFLSLAACSHLPANSSAQSSAVVHPDVFNSYID